MLMGKIKSFVIQHKLELLLLTLILLIGAFMRLYKINGYMTFLGAIPLLLANFNPVGPAVFIAILGVVTIFFVWWVIREWFGDKGALIGALLYAISPVVIIYSRSSWNPNIMPFFSLLTIYAIWRVWSKKQLNWLIVAGISFALVLQSHYLGLLLLPVLGIFWILTYLKNPTKKRFFVFSLISIVLFLLIMSPLAIFDFRHNFINFKAMKAFFSDRQTTVSIVPWKAIPGIWPILLNIASDIVGAKNSVLGFIVSIVISLTFLFTVPFILIGGIVNKVFNMKNILYRIFSVIFVVAIIFIDLQNSPLISAPNMQLTRAEIVAKKVEEIANGQRFNFALIADSNYDSAYRYFLNLDHAKVIDIDPQNTNVTVTDQLIVVCERVKAKCDPTHNPKTEIAAWGWSKVVAEWDDVYGVTIYKLGHVLH